MSLVVQTRPAERADVRGPLRAAVPVETEYHFLLGRYIDAATLARANALAVKWGVAPHDVLIANGWLDADDYYRSLAHACGADFTQLDPARTALPDKATPRQCLAVGLLKERARTQRYVLAPERLRPNALRVVLAQLAPHAFALATPRAVRNAICHHFAHSLARNAVETLAVRRPELSARVRTARWQLLSLAIGAAGLGGALLVAPIESIRAVTLLLSVLFVPVIGLRIIAAYGLWRGYAWNDTPPPLRVPDSALPTYTILAPLFREAHMLPSLIKALRQIDWPA